MRALTFRQALVIAASVVAGAAGLVFLGPPTQAATAGCTNGAPPGCSLSVDPNSGPTPAYTTTMTVTNFPPNTSVNLSQCYQENGANGTHTTCVPIARGDTDANGTFTATRQVTWSYDAEGFTATCSDRCYIEATANAPFISAQVDIFFTTAPPTSTTLPPPPTCDGRTATIIGTSGNDTLYGTPGPDVIVGLGGADVIYGLGGDDVVCGGDGGDQIYGGDGNDRIFGQAGNDTISGQAGNDFLGGGADSDTLYGGDGDDALDGGTEADQCYGMAGTDTGTACETYYP